MKKEEAICWKGIRKFTDLKEELSRQEGISRGQTYDSVLTPYLKSPLKIHICRTESD
jgi:hypothetical protein